MQFKRIEICGFKSFPELIKLEFKPGITAIVGPNGCGKTNILDAIRWVLGEQSAKILRGKEMIDLIFNGGTNKKPQGMAEVSLVLYDAEKVLSTEYNEVTVTRRLFRSGESEYLINRNICRLRDIQELFMDTGVGSNVYSIIEQSQTDLILSNNPTLRRNLFEEAAGVTKYKVRKKETLRKLETTEQNLLRLYDIIAEVKRQKNSLKRQANRAERYKIFYDECKELELKLDSFKYYDWQEKYQKYKAELTGMEDKREGFLARISSHEADVEKTDLEILQLEDKLSAIYESRKAFFERVENLTREVAEGNEKARGLKERGEVLIKEVEEGENRTEELETDLESKEESDSFLKTSITREKEELDVLGKEIDEMSARKKDSDTLLKEKETKLAEIENKLWIKQREKEELDKDNKDKDGRKDCGIKTLDEIRENTGSVQKNLNEKKDVLSFSEDKIKDWQKDREELKKEQSHNQTRIEEIVPRINNKNNEFTKLDSQIKTLEHLEKESAGYSRGIKELMEAGKNGEILNEGIFTPLVTQINVPAEFKAALEVALGEGMYYFLTDNINKVNECINYLYLQKKGRVTFLPLESFRNKDCPRSELSGLPLPGKIQPLLDLVETDERLKPIISFLLRGVFVVEEVPLEPLLKKLSPEVRLVTKKGELFSSELISGGEDSSEADSVIGREKTIDGLKQEAEVLKQELDDKTREKEELEKKHFQLQSQIIGLDEEIKKQEDRSLEEERQFIKLELEANQLIKDKDDQETTLKEIEGRLESNRKEGVRLAEEIGEVGSEREIALSGAKEVKDRYEELDEEESALIQSSVDKKIKLASLKEKSAANDETKEQLRSMITGLKDEVMDKREEIEQAERSSKSEEEMLISKNKELDEIKQDGNQKDFGRDDLEGKQKELRQKLKEKEDKIKEERQKLRELEEKISQLQIKEAELRVQQESLKEKMGKIYNFSFKDDSKPCKEELDNVEEINSRIEELQTEMNKMGLVNMVALEEYKEIEERFDFLTSQQNDLEEAKNNLNETISRINKESETKFRATFDKIRENFTLVFTKFFKEGRADILLSPGDVFESNIDIVAQPPGKRSENIQLLSGGERALTAFGLLLAIFMVKPSPFLILDEVDAPLDDPNTQRFTGVIKEFSKDTQFITITHNKKTMEMADCLYGVTMEEPGVSKIVSVSFQKDNNKPGQDNLKKEGKSGKRRDEVRSVETETL